MVKNRNVIPNFPRGGVVVTFCLITGHYCLVAHLHRLSIFLSPVLVLWSEENSIMNKDHVQKCTIRLKQSNIVKICWDAEAAP
jgi:hypothetical protein